MNILSELQSRKLGIIDLLSLGYYVYWKNWKLILKVFCLILLPFVIVFSFTSSLVDYVLLLNSSLFTLVYILFFIISFIIYYLSGLVFFVMTALITENFIWRRKNYYQNIKRTVFSRFWTLLSLSFRFTIIYILRSLLLIIPGIIYGINNGYFNLALILRDQQGRAAFNYSRAIVRGNWWRVFFFLLLFNLVIVGFSGLSLKILQMIQPVHPLLINILSLSSALLISGGIIISIILLFFNLEFQKGLKSTESINDDGSFKKSFIK